jgi:hypothetical protein
LGRDLFYTRRVSNPKFAFKLTGKERGYTIGILGALNRSEEDNQYLGVFRVKKDIFKLSSVTVTYSGYNTPSFTNHNGGMTLNLQFSKTTRFTWFSKFAYNSDVAKQEFGHHHLNFTYKPDEGLSFYTSLRRIEKNFRPRAGFTTHRDIQYLHLNPGYSKRMNKYGLKKISYSWDIYFYQDTSGQKIGNEISPLMLLLTSMKQHYFFLVASFGKQRAQVFGEEDLEWTKSFFKADWIAMHTGYSGGRFYSYRMNLWYGSRPVFNDEFTEAYDGRALSLSGRFGLKPTSFLNLSVDLEYTRQKIAATGEEIFEGILTSTNIRYQISRQVFLSSYVQHDSHFKRVNLDLILGIELGMANLISLSYKGFYPLDGSPFEDKARSFVIKASYLIRI